MKLTDMEQHLLQSVFADYHDTDSDNLYHYQKEALKQLRGAISYLQEKYPSSKIQYRIFDPLTKLTEKGILICSFEESDALYRVIIRYKNGTYTFTDTLYGYFLREKYDEMIMACLSPCEADLKSYTYFYTPAGRELNQDSTIEQLNEHIPHIMRHTDLFAQSSADAEKIKECLKKHALFASYSLYRLSQEQISGILNFSQLKENAECESFSVYAEDGDERDA